MKSKGFNHLRNSFLNLEKFLRLLFLICSFLLVLRLPGVHCYLKAGQPAMFSSVHPCSLCVLHALFVFRHHLLRKLQKRVRGF